MKHDHERGGTWVISEAALDWRDAARYEDLARRFPDHYKVGSTGGGTLTLLERKVLMSSPEKPKK